MPFRFSSETLTPNSSSTLNMNSMKLSESMPSVSSCACGSRLFGSMENSVAAWLAQYHRLGPGELASYLYTFHKEQAVRHAFRVASGLDSMVLGEQQILGQMKEAARAAESAGTLGTVLHKLFQRSFAVAKE